MRRRARPDSDTPDFETFTHDWRVSFARRRNTRPIRASVHPPTDRCQQYGVEVVLVATTTQRGLGWEHQKQRKRLLAKHRDGDLCAHCGEPMLKSQPLQADHTIPRSLGGTKADRLLHAWCNESRGNGTRVPSSAADAWQAGITSRDWLDRHPPTPPKKSGPATT